MKVASFFQLFVTASAAFSVGALAQGEAGANGMDNAETLGNIPLSFPVIDLPYTFESSKYSPLSMSQSIAITKGTQKLLHYSLGLYLPVQESSLRGVLSRGAFVLFDVFTASLPTQSGWLHEEWHMAVMARRGISSYNGMYDVGQNSNVVAVSRQKDEQLVALKRDHPADQIRLSEAGMEAELELATSHEKDLFFVRERNFNLGSVWLALLGPYFYRSTCNSHGADKTTEEQMAKEGASISKRDFIGLDCLGWVRDLHRPDEGFEERGTHPSGVGIKRYTKYSDLTVEEKRYLRRMTNMGLLNLVDPFLVGRSRFEGANPFTGNDFYWNAAVRHHLTSFGDSLDLNFFFEEQGTQVFAVVHNYRNKSRYFPGVDVTWFGAKPFGDEWPLSTRVMGWLQPRDQKFAEKRAQAGGLLSLKLNHVYSRALQPFVELEGKSEGWVAGNVYLDKNVSLRAGVESLLF